MRFFWPEDLDSAEARSSPAAGPAGLAIAVAMGHWQQIAGRGVEDTHDFSARFGLAAQIQSGPDNFGAVPHDPDPHAGLDFLRGLKTLAVVLNREFEAVVLLQESHDDDSSLAVIDRVEQGFLGDVIEMQLQLGI